MKTTLKDLLHSINVLEEDIDVTVDGCDTIAVVAPVKFTPDGLKKFEKVLNIECEGCLVGLHSREDECEEAFNLLAHSQVIASVKTTTSGLMEKPQK